MKIIRWMPITKFNFFGIIIANRELSENEIRHERIHAEQMKETFYVFFYLYYFLEWVLRGFNHRKVSFEREAYEHEWDWDYLDFDSHLATFFARKPFAWRDYLWK